jgi:hypothetical protein
MQRIEYPIGSLDPVIFKATKDEHNVDWDATAQVRRQAYVAYLRAGFTSEQALELCKLVEFA